MEKLEVCSISKSFRKKEVLKGVNCVFSNGITALLGPNGAGKSTLINIMCTLLEADGGSVKYNGCDIKELKEKYLGMLGVQFQNQPMYKNYTAEEYLQFCGSLKGMSKEEIKKQSTELLQYFGLEADKKKRISFFSGGMKQRLALCGTFLGRPKVIFLDEPSAGLDIYEREELKRMLFQIKNQCIIIISTHIVSDVENIADNIILLNEGEILSNGTQNDLIKGIENCIWEITEQDTLKVDGKVYHSDGKLLCFSENKPCEHAIQKKADLTDVYFSYLQTR